MGGNGVGYLMVGYLMVRMGGRTGGRGVGYLMVRMGGRTGGRGVGYLMVRMGGRTGGRGVGSLMGRLVHLMFGSQEPQIFLRLMLGRFHFLESFFHFFFEPQVILGWCMCVYVGDVCVCVMCVYVCDVCVCM